MSDSTTPTAAAVSRSATFAEWWVEFMAMRVDARASTLRRDTSIYRNHLNPVFGEMALDAIDFRSAQRFVADLAGSGLAPRTVHKAVGLFTHALDLAVRSGLLVSNPTRGLALPQVPHKQPRFLTPEQVERLADAIDPRFRSFVLVGAYCGLRHGELAALRAGQIDVVGSTIAVMATRTIAMDGSPVFGPPKSRAGVRTVPVPGFVMAELAAYIAGQGLGSEDLVWRSASGAALVESNFRSRVWKPATAAAGLEGLRVHDLRHTCVALWGRSLASPRAAAKWAGHSNPTLVLTVYGGVFDDESAGVMDRLSAYATGA